MEYSRLSSGYPELSSGCSESSSEYSELRFGYSELSSGYSELWSQYSELDSECPDFSSEYLELSCGYSELSSGCPELWRYCIFYNYSFFFLTLEPCPSSSSTRVTCDTYGQLFVCPTGAHRPLVKGPQGHRRVLQGSYIDRNMVKNAASAEG